MKNKIFLITRPNYDLATNYLFEWCKGILNFAEANNLNYHDFSNINVTKKEIAKFIQKRFPRFLFFNGHGGPDVILGHKNETLIKAGENEDLLKSTITYALACDSAVTLGQKAVETGADAFIGYEAKFGFVHDASRECTPTKDRFAQPFFEASNELVLNILRGNTVGAAYEKSQKKHEELIRKYSTSDAIQEYTYIRFWLFWNKHFQKVHGNLEAVF